MPSTKHTTGLDRHSSIANFLNHITDRRYELEKRHYEDRERLAKYKTWEEFIRLAISRQYLEGRGPNARVEVHDQDGLLSSSDNRRSWLGVNRVPGFDEAMANLDRAARHWANDPNTSPNQHRHDEQNGEAIPRYRIRGDTHSSEGHRRGETYPEDPRNREHSYSHRLGGHRHEETNPEDYPRQRRQLLLEAPPIRSSYFSEDYDARRPLRQESIPLRSRDTPSAPSFSQRRSHLASTHEDRYDAPLRRREYIPARSGGEYVIPAPPPILITMPSYPSQSDRQSTRAPSQTHSHRASYLSPPDASGAHASHHGNLRGSMSATSREPSETSHTYSTGYARTISEQGESVQGGPSSHTGRWVDNLPSMGHSDPYHASDGRSSGSGQSARSSYMAPSEQSWYSAGGRGPPNWGGSGNGSDFLRNRGRRP